MENARNTPKKVKSKDLLRKLEQILFAIETRNKHDAEFNSTVKKWLERVKSPESSQASSPVIPRLSPEASSPSFADVRAETANKTKADYVGSRSAVVRCEGCADFACVLTWKHFGHVPTDRVQDWMTSHGIIKRPSCPIHAGGNMKLEGTAYVCTARVAGKGAHENACRRRIHVCHPVLNVKSFTTAEHLIKFWAHVANGEPNGQIVKLMAINKNTVSHLFDLLSSACIRYNASATPHLKFQRLSVDETYIGSRKFHRGKPTYT